MVVGGGFVDVGGGGGGVLVPPPPVPVPPPCVELDPPFFFFLVAGGATLNFDVHGRNWIGCCGAIGHGVGGNLLGSSWNAAAAKRPQMVAG